VLPRTDDLCEKFQKGDEYHNAAVELSQGCPHEVMMWPQSKYYDSIQRVRFRLGTPASHAASQHDRVRCYRRTDVT
jgi:hypothetical protein